MSMLNVADIADRGHVTINTVYVWIKEGQLVGHRVRGTSGRMRYECEESDVDAFLSSRNAYIKRPNTHDTVRNAEECYPLNLVRILLDQTGSDIDIWDVNFREFQMYLQRLTEREQKVLTMRFQTGMSLDDVGAAIGVTRERIRQIQIKAMRKLSKFVTGGYCEMVPKRDLILANDKVRALEERIAMMKETEEDPIYYKIQKRDTDSLLIEELDLSVRTFNCLRRAGLTTLNDLIRFDMAQKSGVDMRETGFLYSSWAGIRNMGIKSYRELKEKIYAVSGYTIGDSEKEEAT